MYCFRPYREWILAVLLCLPFTASLAVEPDSVRVILLGTGGPELSVARMGMATLMEAGGERYLFDSGRGVMQQLYESRVNPASVNRIFYTHLHNDHIEGLPNLWITSWFLLGRNAPYNIWGPQGTGAMLDGMRQMYQFDITHRANAFNDPAALAINAHEITKEGVVYQQGKTRITAFPVEHHDGNPAFGYLFEYGDRKVMLSGDTTYHKNLIRYGKGVDVIIQNVIAMTPAIESKPEMRGVLAKLTTIPQAASIFNATHPRLAVYSHIVKKGMPGSAGDQLVLQRTRDAGYAGLLLMGQDRMIIDIASRVKVTSPQPLAELPDLDKKSAN